MAVLNPCVAMTRDSVKIPELYILFGKSYQLPGAQLSIIGSDSIIIGFLDSLHFHSLRWILSRLSNSMWKSALLLYILLYK